MWDLVENEYSKKYGIGCATFFRDKQLKTAMVMYKYNGRSIMFCYSEYDNKILYDGDKDEIEMTIKKETQLLEGLTMWDLMGNNYSEVYGIGYALLNGISAGFYVSVMYKDLGDEIYFYYLDNAPYGKLDDSTKNKIEDIIRDDLNKRHIFGED